MQSIMPFGQKFDFNTTVRRRANLALMKTGFQFQFFRKLIQISDCLRYALQLEGLFIYSEGHEHSPSPYLKSH